MNASADRSELRRAMRLRRRSLDARERRAAARAFAATLRRSGLVRPGLRVAAYVSHAGEADPTEAIALLRVRGAHICLPVIRSYRRPAMDFVAYPSGALLRHNRFGIAEPDTRGAPCAARSLDLILIPLVAVDARGWRLGSGLGFYDRRLAHLRVGRVWRRPRLIGIAYELQRIERLDPEVWDVPLDGLITERNYYRFTARGRT